MTVSLTSLEYEKIPRPQTEPYAKYFLNSNAKYKYFWDNLFPIIHAKGIQAIIYNNVVYTQNISLEIPFSKETERVLKVWSIKKVKLKMHYSSCLWGHFWNTVLRFGEFHFFPISVNYAIIVHGILFWQFYKFRKLFGKQRKRKRER